MIGQNNNQLKVRNESYLDVQEEVDNPIDLSAEDYDRDENFSNELLVRERSFLKQFFPNEADRIAAKFKAELAQTQATSRLEVFRMFKEFHRQSLKEVFDGLLIRGKGQVRKDNTEFFLYHTQDLQEKVNKLTDDYFTEAEKMLEAIENIKNVIIKKRKNRMLMRRLDEFEETVDLLMDNFKNILHEGV